MRTFTSIALILLSATFALPVARAGLVTHYDATALTAYSNGQTVSQWTDISGNANHALQTSTLNGLGVFDTNGIGGLPSIKFEEGQGYDSAFSMGTKFGIQGDASWTMMAVFRINAGDGRGEIVGFGHGHDRLSRSAAAMEIDSSRLDIAGAWSHDLVLDGTPSPSFGPFITLDVLVTITHESGLGGGTIFDTTKLWINGWAPGQAGGPLENNFLTPTGGTSTTQFNVADRPLHIGRSSAPGFSGFSGLISEIRIYDTALAPSERSNVESQLIHKYSIQGANAAVPEPSSLWGFAVLTISLGAILRRRVRSTSVAT